jgi:acyl-CoA synthetase (NDP forming)
VAPSRNGWRPDQARGLLEAYGIATPRTVLADSPEAAARAAEEIGFPVALKLVSPSITHKSDVGGVVLDVRRTDEVVRAYEDMAHRLERQGRRAEMTGVTVQTMVKGGVEAVIGMTRDASFGPLLMFGLGGVQVELLKDVVFRVHPLSDRDAAEMVRGIKGAGLFDGYRGAPPSDIAALQEMLLRVSQMVGDHPEILEMDLNPVSVRERGQGCVVLDARIAVQAVTHPAAVTATS